MRSENEVRSIAGSRLRICLASSSTGAYVLEVSEASISYYQTKFCELRDAFIHDRSARISMENLWWDRVGAAHRGIPAIGITNSGRK